MFRATGTTFGAANTTGTEGWGTFGTANTTGTIFGAANTTGTTFGAANTTGTMFGAANITGPTTTTTITTTTTTTPIRITTGSHASCDTTLVGYFDACESGQLQKMINYIEQKGVDVNISKPFEGLFFVCNFVFLT